MSRKIYRPGKKKVSPKVVQAIELIPQLGQNAAAEKIGISKMTLRRALQKNPYAKSYLAKYLIREGIKELELNAGLLELTFTLIHSAERAAMSEEHEGEFEISEKTALPLQALAQFTKIGSELLNQRAEFTGAKVQAATNPVDRQPREERIKAIVAELIAEGRAEDSAYRIAEYQLELEERRLSSQLVQ